MTILIVLPAPAVTPDLFIIIMLQVKLLDRYRCNNCPQKVEMTWDQDEVPCKGCNSSVTKNEHSVDPRAHAEDDDDDQ